MTMLPSFIFAAFASMRRKPKERGQSVGEEIISMMKDSRAKRHVRRIANEAKIGATQAFVVVQRVPQGSMDERNVEIELRNPA